MKSQILRLCVLISLILVVQTLKPVGLNDWIHLGFRGKTTDVYSVPSTFRFIEFENETSEKEVLIQISKDSSMKEILLDTQRDHIGFANRLNVDFTKEAHGGALYLKFTCLLCDSIDQHRDRFQLAMRRTQETEDDQPRENLLELTSNAVIPREITEENPIELDFSSQSEYGFYFNLTTFAPSEDAYLFLNLDQPADLSSSSFFFILNQQRVLLSEIEFSKYVPQDTDQSLFHFSHDKGQYIRMYWQFQGQDPINHKMFFLIKFKTPTPNKGKLIVKRMNTRIKSFPVTTTNLTIPLSETEPYLVGMNFYHQFNSFFLFFSNSLFNVYLSTHLQEVSKMLQLNIYAMHQVSSARVVLEFFGPSGTSATLLYRQSDIEFLQTDFDGEQLEANNLKQWSSLTTSTLHVLSLKGFSDRKNKWLYVKKELGRSMILSYSAFDKIEESEALFIPTQNYTASEPISIVNDFVVVQIYNSFNNVFKVGVVEKKAPITIEDIDRESYVHILEGGEHTISLKNLLRRHLKVTLIQIKPESIKDIEVTVNGVKQVINMQQQTSVQFLDLQVNTMTIINPHELIVLEFKLNAKEAFKQFAWSLTPPQMTDKLIYFKCYESGIMFDFEFTQVQLKDIKFNVGLGDNNFISKPIYPFFDLVNTRISVYNPFHTNQAATTNEFFYVSFSLSETVESYTVRPMEVNTKSFLPIRTLNKASSFKPLRSSKKIEETLLVIIAFQCTETKYELSLKEIDKSVFSYSGSKGFEIIASTNVFMTLDLILTPFEGLQVAYNYFTDEEMRSFGDLRKKELFVLFYDDSKGIVKWSNPNGFFTKFYLFIESPGTDLSTECVLLNNPKYETLMTTEFSLDDSPIMFGDYQMNILAMTSSKINFPFAYQQKTITYLRIPKLSAREEPLPINFKKPFIGEYIQLDSADEEGVIALYFDTQPEAPFGDDLIFVVKVVTIGIDEEVLPHLPQNESEGEFAYAVEMNNRYVRMRIRNNKRNTDPTKRDIVAILLKFAKGYDLTGKLSYVKVVTPAIEVDTKPIFRQSVDIKEYAPYLFKFKKTTPTQPLLFFSDLSVTLFKGSMFNSLGGLNANETLGVKYFDEPSSIEYIAEYFGPAGKVSYHFEKVKDIVTVIPPEKMTMQYPLHCNKSSLGKWEYFAGSYAGIPDYKQYQLFLSQLYGSVNAYYTNTISIKAEDEKTILPDRNSPPFPGITALTTPYFVMGIECAYFGEGHIQLLKENKKIQLDAKVNSVSNLFPFGRHVIPLNQLNSRSIEITLIQSQELKGVVQITDEVTPIDLSIHKVARYANTKAKQLQLNNNCKYAVLDFKIVPSEQMKKVKGDGKEETTERAVYYQCARDRAPSYLFKFNRPITSEITYTLNKGTDDFILSPSLTITVNEDGKSFNLPNPYYSLQELQPNEFWYVSMKMPDDAPYSLLVETSDSSAAKSLPVSSLNPLNEIRHSLEMSQNSKDSLVVFLAQCKQSDVELRFFYGSRVDFIKGGTSMRQFYKYDSKGLPLEMEYAATIPSENFKYLLSYNYVAFLDAEKIQSSIEKAYKIQYDGVDTLTWDKFNVPIDKVRLYLTPQTSTDKIQTECEMLESSNSKIVEGNAYNLTEHKMANGKYRVNVLIESNDKLQYAIAYNELSFAYEKKIFPEDDKPAGNNNTTGIAIGVSVGVIAVIAMGIGVFCYRRKRRHNLNPMFSQLITLNE